MPSSAIDKAKTAVENKQYDDALQLLDQVIADNKTHFVAHLEKALAHQKKKQYNEAIYLDALRALEIAKERNSRSNVALAYFRISVIFYFLKKYYKAVEYLKYAQKYGYEDKKIFEVWFDKVVLKLGAGNDEFYKFLDTIVLDDSKVLQELQAEKEELFGKNEPIKPKAVVTAAASAPKKNEPKVQEITEAAAVAKAQPSVLPKAVPAPPKLASAVTYPAQDQVRKEFYETPDRVTISFYIKQVPKDSFKINFLPQSLEFEFKTPSGSDYMYELDKLTGEIDPKESSYSVFGTKIEVVLTKKTKGLWKSLQDLSRKDADAGNNGTGSAPASTESRTLQYPSSSSKKIDWSKVDAEIAGEDDDQDDMKLFKDIYKNADSDTKRAMMKSYIESNGTALSTNWSEVSQKQYEVDPPDGMVAKKWNE